MANIAVILANDFEDSEYSKPANVFTTAGHQLTLIDHSRDETVHGKNKSASAKNRTCIL